MSYAKNEERNRVMHQALRSSTLAEVTHATRELDQWVDSHPDDLGIIDAYEVLENMKEIAEFQQAEHEQGARVGVAA